MYSKLEDSRNCEIRSKPQGTFSGDGSVPCFILMTGKSSGSVWWVFVQELSVAFRMSSLQILTHQQTKEKLEKYARWNIDRIKKGAVLK